MAFGEIAMPVPKVFNPFKEKERMYVSSGPAATITVSPVLEIDLLPSRWDKTLAADILEPLYGGVYSDIELSAFSEEVSLNGHTGV